VYEDESDIHLNPKIGLDGQGRFGTAAPGSNPFGGLLIVAA
jgi:hypothetical protein